MKVTITLSGLYLVDNSSIQDLERGSVVEADSLTLIEALDPENEGK